MCFIRGKFVFNSSLAMWEERTFHRRDVCVQFFPVKVLSQVKALSGRTTDTSRRVGAAGGSEDLGFFQGGPDRPHLLLRDREGRPSSRRKAPWAGNAQATCSPQSALLRIPAGSSREAGDKAWQTKDDGPRTKTCTHGPEGARRARERAAAAARASPRVSGNRDGEEPPARW